ncbi:response regulator [Leptospira gomenensis]|uniref:histidine kinase n=1 Tax=Leptospira gomenensis TaxID=2484974 RepID=A0A5F1YH99_9LEPT|nr:response regulator [Leptospira gomenensis]TGK37517.1 response regulator [Leptospira gomenensis]TGK39477.1 response regulator [Leptospira gomenensis]TGK43101.1 response regulator [Leptospira gomenensis]TGK55070.1 response regulator [Leptospira gomenensis]
MNRIQSDFNYLLLDESGTGVNWNFTGIMDELSSHLEANLSPAEWNWETPKRWNSFWKKASVSERIETIPYTKKNGDVVRLRLRSVPSRNRQTLLLFSVESTNPESETPSLFSEDPELRTMLFQKSANAILLLDPESDVVLDHNATAMRSFEVESAESIRSRTFPSLFADLSFEESYRTLKRKFTETENVSREAELQTLRGKKFWANLSFRILSSSRNRILLVQLKDVTEKIQAEKSLAEHEANLNAIIENSEALIWSVDKDYKLIIYNSRFETVMKKYYGPTLEPGRSIFPENVSEENIRNWKSFYDRALSGERFSVNGTRPGEKEGETVFSETSFYPIADPKGRITGVSAVSVDITEKKLAEEKFRILFEHSSEPHVLYDENGIFECNPAALNMLRCRDKNLLLGKHPASFSSGLKPDGSPVQENVRETEERAVKKGSYTFERMYKRMNGELFPAEITLTPMTLRRRTVFLAVWHEFTERKEYEDSLKRAKEIAEAASKAKTDFLAMMSHEIRTPLNGVIGTVSLLEGTSLSLEQKEYVDIIKSSGQNLLILLNDILDLSRIESGQLKLEPQPVSASALSQDVVGLFRSMAEEKGLQIEFKLSSTVPNWIVADPFRLRQILMNLLGNSIKFTEKGRISLNVEAEKFPNDKLRLIFRVQDTGIGIPEEKLELLFKAFNQLDSSTTRKYGGSGLGLTISKKLAELMKGEIIVKSQVGRGSEFSLSILTEKLDYKVPAGIQELHSKNLARLALISVRDVSLREQIKKFCERSGFSVRIARSGADVVRIVSEEERIGIFLTDLDLPDKTLPEILDELKNSNPNLRLTVILFMESEFRNSYYTATEGLFNRPGFKIFMMFKPILLDELAKNFEKAFPVQTIGENRSENGKQKLSEDIPLRILLVEDNVINQKIALRLLTKLGYSAETALNGVEALSHLEKREYDLIFMDIQMPEMDGFETTQRIRKNDRIRRPVIVAMTANAMEGDRERCIEAGMDAYISKPVQIADIESTITHLFTS